MKHMLKLMLLATTAAAAFAATVAFAGQSIDESRPVPPDAIISIENMRGEVEIRGWDRDEVAVEGELDDLAEAFVFDVDGRHVRVHVKMPKRDVNWGDGSDLEIKVPRSSRVGFEGVSSDVRIESVGGGVKLRTVSGDIEAEDLGGQLLVNSVSGDVAVSGVAGRAQVSTISGEIEVESSGRVLAVDTVSGDVEVELGDFEELTGRTVSGDLELDGRLARSGTVSLNSVSGDIRLRLEDPVHAELQVKAGIGGEIRNSMTDDEPKDVFPSQQELKAVAGDGSGRIRISTVSADVRLN